MENVYDYLIIGAGPAGLQLGYFLQKAGRSYQILEAGESPGTFFKRFPRHRTLISNNKVFTGSQDPELNLRWDWNSLLCDDERLLLKNYSTDYFPRADVLVAYLNDFASRYALNVRCGAKVTKVTRPGDFVIEDEGGNSYRSKRLVVATGFTEPYVPPIPGIELTENYADVSVDPADFVNQRVLIIGKGNSGFETAENLIPAASVIHVASPTPLNMAWKTHFVGHLRAVNNNFLDSYQLKMQNAVLDATVERVERRGDKYAVAVSYTHAQGEREELIYDRVIVAAGFRMDDSIFGGDCRPELVINDRFPAQTSEWESTNVPDLYFAGTLTQARDFKKATSGFIHGFRYNVRALHRMFEQKYHGNPWPRREVEPTPEARTAEALRRVNSTSALWQQFGFLCDLIVETGDGPAAYYEEMPMAYAHEREAAGGRHYYTLTLEFGKILGDPFDIARHPAPSEAGRSTFLHPVVRHFVGGRLLNEHHVLEDLYGEWRKPDVHVRPLLDFFTREMRELAAAGD
jgi:thioredoxin reductase